MLFEYETSTHIIEYVIVMHRVERLLAQLVELLVHLVLRCLSLLFRGLDLLCHFRLEPISFNVEQDVAILVRF